MNLGELRDYCGTLLDYDPVNQTYVDQLNNLLNESQSRILTDRPWEFSQREDDVWVKTDVTYTATFTNSSPNVAGTFPYSTDVVLPGSPLEGGRLHITDSAGTEYEYEVRFVSAANNLVLDRPYAGLTGVYVATISFRAVPLLSDVSTIQSLMDLQNQGAPIPLDHLGKYTRDDVQLDPALLGTPSHYIPSDAFRVPAPRTVTGVAVITPGAGRGVRTINVYAVNVRNPHYFEKNASSYPRGVSAGFESALSPVATYNLTDTQELTFTPEVVPNTSGLYRRYYYTSPDQGIDAPIRIRDDGTGVLDQDTISPAGTVTITADTRLSVLQSQAQQAASVRYVHTNGMYQSFLLYPHPSADQGCRVRSVVTPSKMYEDQDIPLIPVGYAQIIAYDAMEVLCLKVDNPALSNVYRAKKTVLYKGMEQRYLKQVPRRIVKGGGPQRLSPSIWGPLIFTP